MPYPAEYQRASDEFARFLEDVRDVALFRSRNEAYTVAQGVFQTFRRRLSLADAIRFAQVLPVGMRALFVADWDPEEPQRPFADRAVMTPEVCWVRPDHNSGDETSIHDVAVALRRNIEEAAFDAVLATLPTGAVDFWTV